MAMATTRSSSYENPRVPPSVSGVFSFTAGSSRV